MSSSIATQLKSGTRCVKAWLLIVSFMFAIVAVLLIIIGSTIKAMFDDFEHLIYDNFVTPATLLVTIGFILLFAAILGAYGAIKESCLLINLYGVFILLVFILDISTFIAAFVMKVELREILKVGINEAMADYNMSQEVKNAVDSMQTILQCCGFDGPSDWSKYVMPIPESCCRGLAINYDRECQTQYQYGCFDKIYEIIILIVACAAIVAFIQLSGAIQAFSLAKTLRRHKSLREAHRWQLQQNLDISISGTNMKTTVNSPITNDSGVIY